MRRIGFRLASGLLAAGLATAGAGGASAGTVARQVPSVSPAAPSLTHPSLPLGGPAGAARSPAIVGDDATLSGVTCTSSSNCFAAGFYYAAPESAVFGLSEQFNGHAWTNVMVSGMGGLNTDVMAGYEVSCGAPTNCMMVGDQYNGNTPAKTIQFADSLSSFDGWQPSLWKNPPHAKWGFLGDVKCVGLTFCLAVGTYSTTSGGGRALAERWDGSRWRQLSPLAPPRARQVDLSALYCLSVSDCQAVGVYKNAAGNIASFTEDWTGSQWKLGPVLAVSGARQSVLNDVYCTAPGQCVAVGSSGGSSQRPLVATLRSGQWRRPRTPSIPGAGLTAVSCPAVTECLAVGRSGAKPLAERWDGHRWSVSNPKATGGSRPADVLYHIYCTSVTSCVAVGVRYNPGRKFSNHTLIEAWKPSGWRIQTSVNPSG